MTQPKRGINHIYTLRKIRGYGQKRLAKLLGCSTSMVSQYERGQYLPSLATAVLLEIVLGARLPELYPGLYEELQAKALKRAAKLPSELGRHIRGRILGKD